jgi:glycosyltransferase involved in cell wall biosynthesis
LWPNDFSVQAAGRRNRMPNVDVVIPLYNKGPWIARAIESVLSQTYSDFQLTIVDDGSTDGGAEIARRFGDPRVKLVLQDNAGPGAARNRGIGMGQAPLVACLDADDEWLPDFLAHCVERLDKHPTCAACVTSWFVEPAGIDASVSHRDQGIREGPWECPSDTHPQSLKQAVDYCHTSASVTRRACLARHGGFYDKNHCTYGEDSYLWLQVLLAEAVYRSPAPMIRFHTDASSLGHRRSTPHPLPPVLRHRSEVLHRCPPSRRDLLERYLNWYAVLVARRMAHQGVGDAAISLLFSQVSFGNLDWSARRRYLSALVRGGAQWAAKRVPIAFRSEKKARLP